MKERTLLLLFVLQAFFSSSLSAQGFSIHGKVQNSIYAYEEQQRHIRAYQYLQCSASTPNKAIALNLNLRALTDSEAKLTSDQRFKAYALNIMLKKLWNERLHIVLGRQFLHPGTTLGALDGIQATARFSPRWRLQIYAGGETLPSRAFDVQNPRDRFVAGGMVEMLRFHATDVQMFYQQKSDQQQVFWQLAGINLNSKFVKDTPLRIQAHFNLKSGDLHRLLLNGRHKWSETFDTELEYKMQRPRVYAQSYFTIFETEPFQRIRSVANWQFKKSFALEGQYQWLFAEGFTAHRMLLGVHDLRGGLAIGYERGDLGDQLTLEADYGYEVIHNLTASLAIDYSRYRTETVYEFEHQLANAARLDYRLGKHWSAVLEYQWLTNRIKKSDSRLLNHIAFRW